MADFIPATFLMKGGLVVTKLQEKPQLYAIIGTKWCKNIIVQFIFALTEKSDNN